MIPYFPFPLHTHKLKAGIAYSVVPNISRYQLFFYSFAILMGVNHAMLTAG
jgi:hypothetical protein